MDNQTSSKYNEAGSTSEDIKEAETNPDIRNDDANNTRDNDEVHADKTSEAINSNSDTAHPSPDADVEEYYCMGRKYRGLLLLITTTKESDSVETEDLINTFKEMEFKFESIKNPREEEEFKNSLDKVLERNSKDLTDMDCLVVIIVTPYDDTYIHFQNGKLKAKELWTPFTADRCPKLAEKPKIFIKLHVRKTKTAPVILPKMSGQLEIDNADDEYTIPCTVDFLLALSKNPKAQDYVSAAQKALLMSQEPNRDLLSEFTARGFVTISTLTKKICFPSKSDPKLKLYDPLERYELTGNKKRLALIFNHKHFSEDFDDTKPPPERTGTDVDKDKLEKTLSSLGFEIETKVDLTRGAMKEFVREVIDKQASDLEILVVAVLTHGDKSDLAAHDRNYPLGGFWTDFKKENLENVPKFFAIQACKGTEEDHGYTTNSACSEPPKHNNPPCLSFASLNPGIENCIVAYSTIPGFFSYRNTIYGTWFIQELCNHLENLHEKELDIQSLLTNVTCTVAVNYSTTSDTNAVCKQAVCIVNTMKKQLFLGSTVKK